MKLYELAYCCRLYGQLTGYDRHLSQLHQQAGRDFDPLLPAHRAALFQWLNGWGCRQFAKQHHATTASESLVRWATSWLGNLPAWPEQLTDLSAARLALCAGAYDALRVLPASRRTLNNGRVSVVTYGPTGTAKTLFALRPNVFPPVTAWTLAEAPMLLQTFEYIVRKVLHAWVGLTGTGARADSALVVKSLCSKRSARQHESGCTTPT
jgi:hypothetical protein